MATNRDLLKEAIADAKAVKETAIANAKAALEEAFTPYLKEKLSAKLAEIEEAELDEDDGDVSEMVKNDGLVNKPEKEDTMEEVSLDELLAELSEDEGEMEESLNEAEKEEEEEEKEEMSIEDMSEEDLKSFIEDVIKDMVEAGELEAGESTEGEEEGESEEEESEEEESEEINLDEILSEDDDLEEEVSLDELLAELEKGDKKTKTEGRGAAQDPNASDEENAYWKMMNSLEEDDDIEEVKSGNPYDTEDAIAYGKYLDSLEESKKMRKELKEAYNAINVLKSELQEINLLNAKLLYTNKLFRNKSLTESQKVKVLEAFDKAASKKEAQLVYETLLENFKTTTTKSPIKESLGSASKVLGGNASSKPIIENDAFARMRELAGLKK